MEVGHFESGTFEQVHFNVSLLRPYNKMTLKNLSQLAVSSFDFWRQWDSPIDFILVQIGEISSVVRLKVK